MVRKIISLTTDRKDYYAVTEDGKTVRVLIDAGKKDRPGNIFIGRVVNINKKMNSAFVDIGEEKNAFMPLSSSMGRDKINTNSLLLVQIKKEAYGEKGALVSDYITLPGRYLVYVPYSEQIGVSDKITDTVLRKQIIDRLESINHNGFGLIARTVSDETSMDKFENEKEILSKEWTRICTELSRGGKPRCLTDNNMTYTIIRDIFSDKYDKFVFDNREKYEIALSTVRTFSPGLESKIELYVDEKYNVFSFYNITSCLRHAFSNHVYLPCGGWLTIEKTEALTVIDINSGTFTGKNNFEESKFEVNAEAMKEIAYQLRIRNIGGIVVVDSIDMKEQDSRDKIIEILNEELMKDEVKTVVVGMSSIGLIEITRKRTGETLTKNDFVFID